MSDETKKPDGNCIQLSEEDLTAVAGGEERGWAWQAFCYSCSWTEVWFTEGHAKIKCAEHTVATNHVKTGVVKILNRGQY